MAVYIRHIETDVPPYSYTQEYIEAQMSAWAANEKERRYIRKIYRHTGIDKRHSVLPDLLDGHQPRLYRNATTAELDKPGTGARNAIYASESRKIATRLARRAIAQCHGITPENISHVITVSCTGFCNPGPDYYIIRELGLSESTQRYHLGFMGCYAVIPALRMAKQFCEADPRAIVLVLSIELCTLHLRPACDADTLLANALFADGAACAIVTGAPCEEACFGIGEFASTLLPGGEQDMAWTIGDHGFDITLSSYVPRIIGCAIRNVVRSLLPGTEADDFAVWAVHPGGKAILDKIRDALDLQPRQIASSRNVMRSFGNMSSATILFVLKELLESDSCRHDQRVCAMAFGPGLTIETAVMYVTLSNPTYAADIPIEVSAAKSH